MASPQPTEIKLSERQQDVLKQLLRRQTSTQRLIRRVRIILAIADSGNNEQVARRLGLHRECVRQWRDRSLNGKATLAAIEAKESNDKSLMEAIDALLAEAYHAGVPNTFSAEQVMYFDAPELHG